MKTKVALLKCDTYDFNTVYEKVVEGIELIGGIESIIPKNKKVLINPNLLASSSIDKAVTTHPNVYKAVAKILVENGYNCTYGDSPGLGDPVKVAQACGIKEISDELHIPMADFVSGEIISYEEGFYSKQFHISNAVLESDTIVNVSKMKAHQLTRITGAVKNVFGCVYGFNKGAMHAKFTNVDNFSGMLVDLNNYLDVSLHVMDGIVAMEGNGPRNGNPVKMNCLIIGTDPVAVDSTFCRLVDIDPSIIKTNSIGNKLGLGVVNEEDIELLGDSITELINSNFEIPKSKLTDEDGSVAKGVRKLILRKPYIIKEKCVSCGICIDACPLDEKAIFFKNDHPYPIYDYDKCIRCFCCQEMAPNKCIDVKTPLLGKLFLYRQSSK